MKTGYLIIGAGLAGCTCGYLLARDGAEVLILEKQCMETKSKLCGGLLTPRALDTAAAVYGPDIDNVFHQSFDHMITVAGRHPVRIDDIRMKSAPRRELDDYAAARFIDAGGQIIDGISLNTINPAERTVTAKDSSGDTLVIEYGTLIAADGALSDTRRLLTGSVPRGAFTLETQVEPVSDEVTMLYNPELFGYCWYIPSGDSANIGCGSFGDPSNLDEFLKWFAERQGVSYTTRRGAFLPTGADICLKAGGAYFIGDAAGLICPPSGEGIYYAMHSARCLARALSSSSSYTALMAPEVTAIGRQFKTRGLFFMERFMDVSLTAAGATPYGKERAIKFALRHFAGFTGK